MSDYKETLNLPNTAFPMKANLAEREPAVLKRWNEIKLYQQLAEAGKNKINKDKTKLFILPDGPPFANGHIHIGHAVNKILKDFILKSKTLNGYYAPFVPGWDCHGLPIELNVEKEVGKPGVKLDAKAFREKCRLYAMKQINLQRDAFIRLGLLGDWENPYMTMNFSYEADIVRALAKIIQNGHLHKGYKPVHWCFDCASTLAEAEVEYQDKSSPSIDVGFPSVDNTVLEAFTNLPLPKMHLPVWAVIWTTTPWTLPANQAVALNAEFNYALVLAQDKTHYYLVAADLVDVFAKRIGLENSEIVATCQGALLEGLQLQHPFYDRQVPIVLGDHVTLETGTGCVHTAPAHGQEDFIIGQKYGLPLENGVGSNGCYISSTPLFAGEHVLKVNDKIIQLLKDRGHLVQASLMQHSYPHCWRHKTPLIFRATQQWFISMEQNGLRKNTLAAIKAVEWIPSWGEARIEGMVKDRPDWCISRQRIWGVPMSVFVHRETGDLHPNTPLLMEEVAKRIEKTGLDAWYDVSIEELLGSDAKDYEKAPHTLDVWFDSGVFHDCVLDKHEALRFPADLYLEGSDQHRGWFLSSLTTAVAIKNKAPYKQVLTHGFVVDKDGRKMSKSLGNVVAPDKVISALGADVLRLWVSATDYRSEIVVSDEILKQTSDIYRRIRNTARFLLANLNGFDPEKDLVPADKMLALDRYIVERANELQTKIIKAYEEYQFHVVYQTIHHYCAVDLGGFYLDIIKDRQYTGKTDGLPRRSAQTALYHIAESLVRWMAPILSFTAEEIWQNLPGKREESVFLSSWYTGLSHFAKSAEESVMELTHEDWDTIQAIRDEVNKVLEKKRAEGIIGSGLEAEIDLYADDRFYKLLSLLKDECRFVFITSRADIHHLGSEPPTTSENTLFPGLRIVVSASVYPKCERCWHRREDVNSNSKYPGICERCIDNIAGDGEAREYA
ncbi:MAG TPA: isoleucine--tRNA ligase [Gammaproteobacteria bacterium]|nr:isoleucine--tRNA ligase [Gammaproteobacteria bacterium]